MLSTLMFCAAALVAPGLNLEASLPDGVQTDPRERAVIEYTNAERISRGLPALRVDEDLMRTARQHAAWMASHRSLQHAHRPGGENIAMGQRDSRSVLRSWMNSSGHRANILNRSYTRIGVAAHYTSSGTLYWCQQFLR